MPSPVPTPVAAALGIVPAVLCGVRSLPGKAVQLPVLALSSALTALDGFRKEYDDLAERGERLIARFRGVSLDGVEDRIEAAVANTPVAGAYDQVEDAVEAALDRASGVARNAGQRMERAATKVADTASTLDRPTSQVPSKGATTRDTTAGETSAKGARSADALVGDVAQAARAGVQAARKSAGPAAAPTPTAAPPPAATPRTSAAPTVPTGATPQNVADPTKDSSPATDADHARPVGKGAPTPKAAPTETSRPDTAATPEVVKVVEQAVEAATEGLPAAALDHQDHDGLPLPDYDHMTLGALRGRLRSLDVDQLVRLRGYEKAHANRLPVVTMLDNRIAKLSLDAAASSPVGGHAPEPVSATGSTAPDVPAEITAPAAAPVTSTPAKATSPQTAPANASSPQTGPAKATSPQTGPAKATSLGTASTKTGATTTAAPREGSRAKASAPGAAGKVDAPSPAKTVARHPKVRTT